VEKEEVRGGFLAVARLVEAEAEGEAEKQHIQRALFLDQMVLGSRSKSHT